MKKFLLILTIVFAAPFVLFFVATTALAIPFFISSNGLGSFILLIAVLAVIATAAVFARKLWVRNRRTA